MKTLYFDCFCGASGDMIVGALLDLGLDLEAIRGPLSSLAVRGFDLKAEKVKKKGVMATQFLVVLDEHTHQPHRHLHHVLDIIAAGDLPEPVKEAAAETFRCIAVAEAKVHGTTIEKIHFHEVGAIDSIVDVVGAHLALYLHGVERIEASPLHAGAGTVQCAHGIMPVPAPATALLLEGVPSYGGDVQKELVTPTGAALMAQVVQRFGPMPMMTIDRVGYGSGTRDLEDRPNVLRAILGETAAGMHAAEPITVVEANVDDMTPEFLAPLLARFLEAGARDAFVAPITGKKGRPGHLITVLCDEDKVEAVADVFFRDSTTFGVRMRTEQRLCLERRWKTARTPWGDVRVKIGALDGTDLRQAPEFEDCRRVAEEKGIAPMAVYQAALAAAVKGELHDE